MGFTTNYKQERFRNHSTNHRGFTGGIGDWIIVYIEQFSTKEEAMLTENKEKTGRAGK